ncbi:radical SAM/SPASM domain-containing protein [Bradyrhizobium sp. AUGA SZCCT0283]|uniref:radical SAM/SPASM domain-containing protein n=1 Tax=Bradyrhizobium sp. AUGA SZCCT0283 TaxID=2807671 RepID=UPI001BAD844D|nr:radical SAM protein [Bradyrhizobium sp. AUGA SZCCT0283]MBR1280203.1 SPASM domain-containing protein [Bradyrhizobium sp. AUGA SZCCT0283]
MRESRYNVWVQRPDAAYVFNSRSGALLRIPTEYHMAYRAFMAGDTDARCPPSLLGNLIAGLMIVRDDADELQSLEKRYQSSRDARRHFALTVVTSLGCNFSCPYCFEEKHPSVLDQEVEARVLEVLNAQLPHIDSFHVTWFGGEPLVGKKSLLRLSDAFIRRCDEAEVRYGASIISNGFLLDEATCRELAARRVTSVQVGLDGPPTVHDRMRPLNNGSGSFHTILANLRKAVHHLDITVRVNIDGGNASSVEELFKLLAEEGFADKLSVYPGQIIGVQQNLRAPSASYRGGCFSNAEFAHEERRFLDLAAQYGLAKPRLPLPTGAPCTAVRANELVVGSHGELYKCWDSVGDQSEVIGDIRDHANPNGRLAKWLSYDPFQNQECRGCIALPVCMGGCAHHAFDKLLYENRCGTFRHTFQEQVSRFVDFAEQERLSGLMSVTALSRSVKSAEAR